MPFALPLSNFQERQEIRLSCRDHSRFQLGANLARHPSSMAAQMAAEAATETATGMAPEMATEMATEVAMELATELAARAMPPASRSGHA